MCAGGPPLGFCAVIGDDESLFVCFISIDCSRTLLINKLLVILQLAMNIAVIITLIVMQLLELLITFVVIFN